VNWASNPLKPICTVTRQPSEPEKMKRPHGDLVLGRNLVRRRRLRLRRRCRCCYRRRRRGRSASGPPPTSIPSGFTPHLRLALQPSVQQ
jgi:hypothetical protein